MDLQEEDSKQSDCGRTSSYPAERSGQIAPQNPRVSDRNQRVGRIESAPIRGLMARVSIGGQQIGGQQITSIITAPSAREMQLSRGQTAAARIKATDVMILRV